MGCLDQCNRPVVVASEVLAKLSRPGSVRSAPSLGELVAKTSLGTVCGGSASCFFTGLQANKCSYIRSTLQMIYQAVNIVAHVMSTVMTVLCGCLFIANQAVCVLSAISIVCSTPYQLYNAIFKTSIQLWEA